MDGARLSGLRRFRRSFFLLAALVLAACAASSAGSTIARAPTNQSSTRGSPEELLRQGAAALQAGQTELAIEDYKAALDAAPQDPAKRGLIEFALGIAYQRARRWQESADTLNAAIRDNSRLGYLAYSILGFSYQQLGRWQEALEAFRQAAKLKPDDAGAQAGIGRALVGLGKPAEAVQPLEKAVRLNPTFAGNHFALGLAYSLAGRLEAAIKECNEAIRLEPNNFMAHALLGEALGESGRFEEESRAEQQAIRLNPNAPDPYYLLGTADSATGRLEESFRAYKKAVELQPDYFEAYAGLAFVSIQLGRTVDAWQALQKVDLLKANSSNYAAYLTLASCYQTFGLWQRAVDSANQAIILKPDCVECYWLLGNGYNNLGRMDEARKAYQRALAIRPNYSAAQFGLGFLAEVSGDLDSAQNFFNAAYRSLGDTTDERMRTTIEAAILTKRGNIQRDLGNYVESFGFYTQAVEKYRLIPDHKQAGTTLVKIAEVYRQIGDNKASAQWYKYALQESEKAGDIDGQLTAMARLGLLAWSMGDEAGSIRYGRQAVELFAKISKDPNSKTFMPLLFFGETGAMLGEWFAENGNPAQAISLLQVRIAAYSRGAQGEASLREIAVSSAFLADAYMRSGQNDQALNALKRALAIAEKYKSPEILWVYLRIGEVHEKQGDLQEALRYYEQAAAVLERFGAAQRLPELQLSAQELTWGVYENLARVSVKLYANDPRPDYLRRAFAFHERGKARALLDLLNQAGVRGHQGIDPRLVSEEDRLRAKVSALQRVFSDESLSGLKNTSLQQALTEQEAALREVHEKIAAANPKYANLAAPGVVSVGDVQALLGDDAVLLEFDLGPEFSGVGVLTNREIRMYRLPSQEVINKGVDEFLPTLKAPLFAEAEIEKHVRLAKGLYRILVEPARDLIRGKRHIVIVPDGSLYYLPFEALILPGDSAVAVVNAASLASQPYVGKIYSVSYAPSSSVLVTLQKSTRETMRNGRQHPLLAFGDPIFEASPSSTQLALSTRGAFENMGVTFHRLPFSADEVRRVAAVYGEESDSGSIYLGDRATKKLLNEVDLTQYRILHFATHAVVGDQVKWITQPALILSPEGTGQADDGILKMAEIFDLRLNADLVVLSACETARGKMSRGEGIIGLTSAFLFAGSRSVVASLWNVNDESTSLFMEAFHKGLKTGLAKPEALRHARSELMQKRIKSDVTGEEESLASPYYWAPFILIGDWN